MLDDLTNLQALLKDSTLLATKGYIAGEWCDGENGQTFPVYNPARGDVITNVEIYQEPRQLKLFLFLKKLKNCGQQGPLKSAAIYFESGII